MTPTDREHHCLLALIEKMQRDGMPEHSIHEVVRQATGSRRPGRERLTRPGTFTGFGRRRRARRR